MLGSGTSFAEVIHKAEEVSERFGNVQNEVSRHLEDALLEKNQKQALCPFMNIIAWASKMVCA
jgi:hypothetical protein